MPVKKPRKIKITRKTPKEKPRKIKITREKPTLRPKIETIIERRKYKGKKYPYKLT